MNKKQLIEVFEKAGYSIYWTKTGSPDWIRGYIQKFSGDKDLNGRLIPCRYGKISIECGVLYNIKFYFAQYAYSDLVDSDFLIYFWKFYQTTGEYLSADDYKLIVSEAERLRKSDYDRKIEKRKEIEAKDKKPKKRPSIKSRCIRRFIEEIIESKRK
jgi:hypothetical protein